MKKYLARMLRRIAQRLSPLLSDGQIRELRAHYCCSVPSTSGVTYNINANEAEDDFVKAQRNERDRVASKVSRY